MNLYVGNILVELAGSDQYQNNNDHDDYQVHDQSFDSHVKMENNIMPQMEFEDYLGT